MPTGNMIGVVLRIVLAVAAILIMGYKIIEMFLGEIIAMPDLEAMQTTFLLITGFLMYPAVLPFCSANTRKAFRPFLALSVAITGCLYVYGWLR